MDISKLPDQEKSVLLAKAVGWRVNEQGTIYYDFPSYLVEGKSYIHPIDSLYNPANMALAFRCHLWALKHLPDNLPANFEYRIWFRNGDYGKPVPWTRKNAQRLWLDKILELAIEAGIIEEER
jgi:hypothetical protein